MGTKIGFLKNTCQEHLHVRDYEILVYTKGHGLLHLGETRIPFSPGTIVILPPGHPHISLSEEEFGRIFISGDFASLLPLTRPTVVNDTPEGDGILLARLLYRNRLRGTDYLTALLSTLLSYLRDSTEGEGVRDPAVRTITNAITEGFFDPRLDLGGLLRESGYSEDYIRARFKRATGKTPVQYLTETRISHACLLIDMYRDTLSLSEIATRCGFTDYLYFSRRFREVMGMPPQEYRRSE